MTLALLQLLHHIHSAPSSLQVHKWGHTKVGNKIDKLNKGYKVAYLTLTNYW